MDINNSNTFPQILYMEIREFEWDDNNIEHISRHNVSPGEVEDEAFDVE